MCSFLQNAEQFPLGPLRCHCLEWADTTKNSDAKVFIHTTPVRKMQCFVVQEHTRGNDLLSVSLDLKTNLCRFLHALLVPAEAEGHHTTQTTPFTI